MQYIIDQSGRAISPRTRIATTHAIVGNGRSMRHATTVTENPPWINHLGSCHIVEIIIALSCHTLVEKEAAEFLLGEVLESLVVSACHDLGW